MKQPVEQELLRFLHSERPEALCVSGPWGTGKTFLWTEIVLPQAKHPCAESRLPDDLPAGHVLYKTYSYVSLFGINSIADLKRAVFVNRRTGKWWEKQSREQLQRNWRSNTNLIGQTISLFFPMQYFSDAVAATFADNVWDQVVVLDDLERKGEDLSMRDLLGFVSHLKDQRRCKVLVLTNSTELGGEDERHYTEHHEKVFDARLIFNPSPNEACAVAGADDRLREKATLLHIANIRIIKKVQACVKAVETHLAAFDASVMEQAVHGLTLFCWVKYAKGAPSLSFIKDRYSLAAMVENSNTDPSKVAWNAALQRYGFGEFDAFDTVLAEFVENGYFDVNALKIAAGKLDRNALTEAASNRRYAAIRRVTESFDPDEEDILDDVFSAFKETMQHVWAPELNLAVGVLRFLGRANQADELIADYVLVHQKNRARFDLGGMGASSRNAVDDQNLLAALTAAYGSVPPSLDPIQAILKIQANSGGSTEDYTLAARATPEAIAAHLKTLSNKEYKDFIAACFASESIQNANSNHRAVANNAQQAMMTIASESRLNLYRVLRLGFSNEQLEQYRLTHGGAADGQPSTDAV